MMKSVLSRGGGGVSGIKLTPSLDKIKGPSWPESSILNSYFLSVE